MLLKKCTCKQDQNTNKVLKNIVQTILIDYLVRQQGNKISQAVSLCPSYKQSPLKKVAKDLAINNIVLVEIHSHKIFVDTNN